MSRPSAADPQAVALAQRAAALEARGEWREAIDAWSSAIERAPDFLPAHVGLAQTHLRAGRPEDAARILERVTSRAPRIAAAWLALGVAHSMLGRHDRAVAAAARATAEGPDVAALHMGLGDVLRQAGELGRAEAAYRRAAALAPEDADALNKVAVIERAFGRFDAAEALLRRALANAPGHPYARVNLGTLALERKRDQEGRAMLEAALAMPRLPVDARAEAADAIAMLDEHAALAPAIAAAAASGDPGPLEAALRARPAPTRRDDEVLAFFERAAARIADEAPVESLFATGVPRSAAWPALVAHHNFRLGGSREAIRRSVDLVAGRTAALDGRDADILRYAEVVRGADVAARGRAMREAADPVAREAWLRLLHALIVGHRPELAPGQFKLVNNIVHSQPQVARTAPGRVAGTLRAWFAEREAVVPPGPWRAACLVLLMTEVHPFLDGNGRVLRYIANAELAASGRFPTLRPGNSPAEFAPLLNEARRSGVVRPLLEWLAAGSRYAAELDREWAAHEPR
ncbi:hypothetical protein BURK1_02450 [Burkholderiales bacterium]|nr:hypothetical protein BURK1_02450 [Burkholderiales bacterium]